MTLQHVLRMRSSWWLCSIEKRARSYLEQQECELHYDNLAVLAAAQCKGRGGLGRWIL
jgi:hypothetical protein